MAGADEREPFSQSQIIFSLSRRPFKEASRNWNTSSSCRTARILTTRFVRNGPWGEGKLSLRLPYRRQFFLDALIEAYYHANCCSQPEKEKKRIPEISIICRPDRSIRTIFLGDFPRGSSRASRNDNVRLITSQPGSVSVVENGPQPFWPRRIARRIPCEKEKVSSKDFTRRISKVKFPSPVLAL